MLLTLILINYNYFNVKKIYTFYKQHKKKIEHDEIVENNIKNYIPIKDRNNIHHHNNDTKSIRVGDHQKPCKSTSLHHINT